ncbi:hypothetical protein JCM33374_g1128 [Metschnikowia sp. JCM 33374]|nr:hypothetical protein JCM33374_g1128 [Metschnikowia sp. JCM 33374]
MPSVSAIALADARLLVLVSSAIVNFPEHTSRVFTPLKAISQNKNVSFTSSTNLLRLLLVYASPIAHSAEEIAALSSSLLHAERSNDLSESDVIEDIENLLSWLEKDLNISVEDPEDAIVHTANDILVDLATKSHSLSLTIDEDSTDPRAALFTFVRAKCLQLGSYYDNVTSFAESFESLRNYAPFKAWLQGVILPYHYYHQNYALPTDRSTPANDYLSLKNYVDVFKYLVSPLESGSESMGPKLQPRAYFSNVILPLAAYNSNDLAPLTAWIFKHHPGCDTIADFEFWDELLRTVLSFHNQSGQFPTHEFRRPNPPLYLCLFVLWPSQV